MRSLILSLTLLLPMLVGAQGFGSFSHDQPFLAADVAEGGGGGGVDIASTNLWAWWIGTNAEVAQATTTVTNWVDIVQGFTFTNVNGSIAPTKTDSYVDFTRASSQYLTNWNQQVTASGNFKWTIGWILKRDDANNADLVNNHPTASSPLWLFLGAAFEYYADAALENWGNIDTSLRDILVTVDGNSSATAVSYTNGVQSATQTLANGLQGLVWCKTGGSSVDGYFDGRIYEFVIWTNKLSSLQISNYHYYATNTYSFSP